MQISYLDVEGQRIRIARNNHSAATDKLPPLLICNGIGLNFEVCEPFVNEISNDLDLILFDPPGVGDSPIPDKPYRFQALAKLVKAMLEQLNITAIDVLGISWGGALAQQLALDYPALCRRIILSATTSGVFSIPGKPSVLMNMVSPERALNSNFLLEQAGNFFGGEFRTNPQHALQLKRLLKLPPVRGYELQLKAIMSWGSTFRLYRLKQPVLLIYGKDDPIVPYNNAYMMKTLLPNAQLELMDCGHLALFTLSKESGSIVLNFLQS